MTTTTENILTFAEDLLVASFVQLNPKSMVAFAEIPLEERKAEMPVRLRAVLKKSVTKPDQSKQSDQPPTGR